jgi:hypothetical protein
MGCTGKLKNTSELEVYRQCTFQVYRLITVLGVPTMNIAGVPTIYISEDGPIGTSIRVYRESKETSNEWFRGYQTRYISEMVHVYKSGTS